MPTISYKEISRKLFEEVWNKGKVELLPELHAPDSTITDPYNKVIGKGPAAALEFLNSYKTAFPDLAFRVDRQVAEGDTVVTFLTATGTHEGPMLGVPASHKKASSPVIVLQDFKNGKILTSMVMWDALTFMRTVGAFEPKEVEALA